MGERIVSSANGAWKTGRPRAKEHSSWQDQSLWSRGPCGQEFE